MMNKIESSIFDGLQAMCEQEEKTPRCQHYFTSDSEIDESCRLAMLDWLATVANTLDFSKDTVWIAMSLFDRFAACKDKTGGVLKTKKSFQLAAIVAFYTAAKIYEPVTFSVDTLVKICRGTYTKSDVESMELEMLQALEWRVSSPQPIDFVRQILQLFPDSRSANILERSASAHLDLKVREMSCCKPSVVAVSCLSSAIAETNVLPAKDMQTFWNHLAELLNLDLGCRDVAESQQRLLGKFGLLKPSYSRANSYCAKHLTSPVCVTRSARQA